MVSGAGKSIHRHVWGEAFKYDFGKCESQPYDIYMSKNLKESDPRQQKYK